MGRSDCVIAELQSPLPYLCDRSVSVIAAPLQPIREEVDRDEYNYNYGMRCIVTVRMLFTKNYVQNTAE
jgi:hypothetical protein